MTAGSPARSTGSGARPGVLFDVDGTLLDTNYLHVFAWAQAFRDAGHDDVPMGQIHRSVGIASEGLTEHLLGEVDDKAVRAHSERYEQLRSQMTVSAHRGAADLVRACAGRGLAPVLATSGKEADLDWMLPALGSDDLAGATTASSVSSGKPDPELLAVAMGEHDLDPARTVMVGDTVWDVQAAARAGIPCIAVTAGGISAAELREAGAVEVYEGPADLLDRFESSVLSRLAD